MAIQFGKTWWGEHWLRSLENVDYDNRLPRGASYARNEHVKEVKIKENIINAKVAGSRPSPYKVSLIVPPFFEDQVELLMQEIIKRPALISKLLNRELDPEMLTIAETAGLKVFPRQWTDFKMQCSCPDWAVPCKHLAAVIYMVSREIDNNPFLVFEIHKVNLIEELKKRGIFVANPKKTEIPALAHLLKTTKGPKKDFDEESAYDRADFSKLHDISEALVQLLPDAPPFYANGNFREKFSSQFLRNAKEAKRVLNKRLDFDAVFPSKNSLPDINHRSTLSLSTDSHHHTQISGENHSLKTLEQLLPAIFKLNPDHLPDYQPSVAAFHKVLFASLHLIANGNVVPQIVQLDNKDFIIRWLPALIDGEVRLLTEKLDKLLPPDLLLSPKITRKTEQLLPLEHQTSELLSIVISKLVAHLSRPSNGDLFEDIFFKNKAYSFSGVGENALSGGMKVWLDRFHLTTENYKPVITVSELENEQFDVQISIEDISEKDQLPVPVSKILRENQYEKQRFKILQTLSLLSPFIRGLDMHINLGGNQPILFDTAEFAPFLMEVLPAVRLLDIKIMLPKSLQELLRPKPTVKLRRNTEQQGYVRLDDLLSFDWQVAIGDTLMSPDEFKKLLKNATGLFRFKENYIYVNEPEMEKLHKFFTTDKPLNSYQLLQTALAEEYEGAPVLLTGEVRELIHELTSTSTIPLPQGLNAQLRPYQERGYSWMYRNSRIGFGSIIADDMGLGKTLQVISILLKFKEENALNDKNKALVVVPTGLLTNWQAEIRKFAPSVSSHIYHGGTRDLKLFDADVMLTTYGVLRSDAEVLKKRKWQVMVIDEAQNIKNQDTAQSKAIKSIPANIRIAMSGTPVENRLTEFWSIMDFANKGYLGNVKTFKSDFADPIQVFNDEQVVAKFRKITSPFMMRRMKSDKSIISDLPDKVEQNQFALLTKQQAALYEKTMQVAMAEIEGVGESEDHSLFKRQGLVLQMILALKQICNHPTNFLKNGNFDPTLSGKTELLFELLDSITQAGEKVLIFTQFREMGDLLERFIAERFGERPMFYHGGCNVSQRQQMVERFQHNRADKIFILSLKAAGTGLNLTAASHVVHYDLWWNPAVENQATDRAYRIGQKKNVMVHRMITKNTFEERIDEMIQKKKHLADMTVATGENWIGKLSNKELREIFG
ncbi:MAG: DEAD/DEAH box helicase [Mangrovibacterium sp.]|nr:DEAD/DEAH box helicase [Mangrovibacterium sp.]